MESVMAYKRTVIFLYLWFAVFAFTGAAAMADEQKPQEGKAASVNGVVITQEDVNRQMFILEQHLLSTQGTAIRPDMVPTLRNQILNRLIELELFYQEAQKQKIVVEEKEVSEKMDALKSSFPSEKVFQDEMRQMNFTEETLRTRIKKDLAVRQLVEKDILVHVKVTDEDAKSFYDSHPDLFKEPEKVRASHILITAEADTDPVIKEERRKKLEGVKKRLDQGEDFAALAKEFSQCPSAEKGGDLGYFERGKMVKPFEDAAFSMNPGDVSDIVVTPFGFHLIKVTDKKPERNVSYEDAKDMIKQRLSNMKFEEQKNIYVAELKKNSKVEMFEH
jgi:peptidyl-prolyl cis-trans isomerase C